MTEPTSTDGDRKQRPTRSSIALRTSALVGSAIASQIINFATMLAVAHLYGPGEVGLFGLFIAVYTLVVYAASWRYEIAIVTVDQEQDAADIVVLVACISVLSAFGCIAVLTMLAMVPGSFGISSGLRETFTGLPLALLAAGVSLAGTNICVRQRRFALIALQQIAVALATAGAQLSLAATTFGSNRLVLGYLIGQGIGVVVLARPLLSAIANGTNRPNVLRRLRHAASVHRHHALYTVPYSLITQLYYQLPLMMLGSFFSTKEVGYFTLAYRTTFTPITLIPTALAQVFFPEMARDRQGLARWEPKLLVALMSLGVLMAPAVAVIMAFGPGLYEFALGESWRTAGGFAQIMVLANLMNGLAGGYDRLYFVLERQRAALIVTCLVCTFSAALMLACHWAGFPATWMVAAWSAGHLVLSTAWLVTIYLIAGFSLSGLLKRWAAVIGLVGVACLVLASMPTAISAEQGIWVIGLVAAYAVVLWRMLIRLREVFERRDPTEPGRT